MNFDKMEIKTKNEKRYYKNQAGEVKEYVYTRTYFSKPNKFKMLFNKYKGLIEDTNLSSKDKINKIYSLEKNNFTLSQIRNFIYRS